MKGHAGERQALQWAASMARITHATGLVHCGPRAKSGPGHCVILYPQQAKSGFYIFKWLGEIQRRIMLHESPMKFKL